VTVSKGESRLIVLAPMLAARAAEYRDLPPHAAGLCALDEVPGDVDDQGRDGIAAYLESLDLDLMSTSHNWDGSPGAWDGIDIFELEKPAVDQVARPRAFSERPAAVTVTARMRPSVSVRMPRFRPMIFLAASVPRLVTGTLLEVFTLWVSITEAVGVQACAPLSHGPGR
jgi:hypothetical protein